MYLFVSGKDDTQSKPIRELVQTAKMVGERKWNGELQPVVMNEAGDKVAEGQKSCLDFIRQLVTNEQRPAQELIGAT